MLNTETNLARYRLFGKSPAPAEDASNQEAFGTGDPPHRTRPVLPTRSQHSAKELPTPRGQPSSAWPWVRAAFLTPYLGSGLEQGHSGEEGAPEQSWAQLVGAVCSAASPAPLKRGEGSADATWRPWLHSRHPASSLPPKESLELGSQPLLS